MKKTNWLNLTGTKVAAMVCALFLGLLFTTSRDAVKQQNENITWQMENLIEGNSFVVLTDKYPNVFRSIEKQFKHSSPLVSGEKKVRFGMIEYNWIAHTTGDMQKLKEFYIGKDDCLTQYKVEIGDELFLRPGDVAYKFKTMKITRY